MPANKNQKYYEILGLSETVSAEEVKKAYQKLAQNHHPDKIPNLAKTSGKCLGEQNGKICGSLEYDQRYHCGKECQKFFSEHEEKFKEIKNAYQVVSSDLEQLNSNVFVTPDSSRSPEEWQKNIQKNKQVIAENIKDQLRETGISLENIDQKGQKKLFIRKKALKHCHIWPLTPWEDRLNLLTSVQEILDFGERLKRFINNLHAFGLESGRDYSKWGEPFDSLRDKYGKHSIYYDKPSIFSEPYYTNSSEWEKLKFCFCKNEKGKKKHKEVKARIRNLPEDEKEKRKQLISRVLIKKELLKITGPITISGGDSAIDKILFPEVFFSQSVNNCYYKSRWKVWLWLLPNEEVDNFFSQVIKTVSVVAEIKGNPSAAEEIKQRAGIIPVKPEPELDETTSGPADPEEDPTNKSKEITELKEQISSLAIWEEDSRKEKDERQELIFVKKSNEIWQKLGQIFTEENDKQAEKINELQAENAQLTKKLENTQEELDKITSTRRNDLEYLWYHEEKYREQKSRKQNTLQKLEEISSHAEKKANEITVLTNELKTMNEKIANANNKITELEAELNKQGTDYQQKIREVLGESDLTNWENKAIKKSELDKVNLQSKLENLQAEKLESAATLNNSKNERLRVAGEKIKNLENELEQAKQQAERELEQARKEVEQANQERQSLRKKIETYERDLKTVIGEGNSSLDNWQNKITKQRDVENQSSLIREIDQKNQEINEKNTKITELEDKTTRLEREKNWENAGLQREVNDLQTEVEYKEKIIKIFILRNNNFKKIIYLEAFLIGGLLVGGVIYYFLRRKKTPNSRKTYH
jgi:curved DNA-binding protein CbpA